MLSTEATKRNKNRTSSLIKNLLNEFQSVLPFHFYSIQTCSSQEQLQCQLQNFDLMKILEQNNCFSVSSTIYNYTTRQAKMHFDMVWFQFGIWESNYGMGYQRKPIIYPLNIYSENLKKHLHNIICVTQLFALLSSKINSRNPTRGPLLVRYPT